MEEAAAPRGAAERVAVAVAAVAGMPAVEVAAPAAAAVDVVAAAAAVVGAND